MLPDLGIDFIDYCPCCQSNHITTKNAVLSPFFAYRALGLEPVRIEPGEFRDIRSGVSYQPCKSIYCLSCESVASSVRLSESALKNYYKGYQDDDFIAMRIRFEPSFAERLSNRSNPNTLRKRGESVSYLSLLEAHYLSLVDDIEPAKIRDFGGGPGVNSPFRDVAQIDIIDIDRDGSASVNRGQGYDLISMLNVLEHVNSPLDTLREASRFASSATRFLIEVPLERFMHDTSSPLYKNKKIWTEHIDCFSAKGLEQLVLSAGLRPIGENPVAQISTSEAFNVKSGENNQALLIVAISS